MLDLLPSTLVHSLLMASHVIVVRQGALLVLLVHSFLLWLLRHECVVYRLAVVLMRSLVNVLSILIVAVCPVAGGFRGKPGDRQLPSAVQNL